MKFPIHDPILSNFVHLDIPLNNLESYAKDIEEFLNNKFLEAIIAREENEDDDEFERNDDDDDDDEDDHFVESLISFSYYQQDSYRYGIEFRHIMRTSLFYSCFAFLENYLLTLCKEVRRRKRLELDISDIRHNGIEKAQVYLKKVAGLPFPDTTKEWNHIRKCNKIRNILIHNGGFIDSENEKSIKEIQAIKGVKVIKHLPLLESKIRLEETFCFEFIDSIRKLLSDVSNEVHDMFDIFGIKRYKQGSEDV